MSRSRRLMNHDPAADRQAPSVGGGVARAALGAHLVLQTCQAELLQQALAIVRAMGSGGAHG